MVKFLSVEHLSIADFEDFADVMVVGVDSAAGAYPFPAAVIVQLEGIRTCSR